MALPTYNKTKRRQTFEQLPKGAYVIEIKGAREDQNKNGSGSHLTIAFDIAEGEYAGFYSKMFEQNTNEDKKWPNDAVFYLTVPRDGSPEYVVTNWNTFFADLEDSNNGFVFGGDVKPLKGKLLGAKMAIEQSEYNGNVYDHTKMRWTCVAEDVRQGKAGKLPNDKLIQSASSSGGSGWVNANASIDDEELPFS
jgi:hypothetical protein